MNTRIVYLYRDTENYKQHGEVVIRGLVKWRELELYLEQETWFIPSEVGLPDLQEMPFKNYDHVWHELVMVQPTVDAPTVSISAAELVASFKTANAKEWNLQTVFKRVGLMY